VVPSGDTTLYAKWEQMANVTVTIKSGVMRWCDEGVQVIYVYDVPYGARLKDVPIDTSKVYRDHGAHNTYTDVLVTAVNGNRMAIAFPAIPENRLEYYEYGLSGHDRFYWGDRFYGDYILWGKYKWRARKGGAETFPNKLPPEPGWDQDYP
jgi:hypothetical protein